MNQLLKKMEHFFNNINNQDLENILIENGYKEIKPSSDFGYELKISNIEQTSNNYNFFKILKTKKYITNEKIGEAA